MKDPKNEGKASSAASPRTYREESSEAIAGLSREIVRKIEETGPIPFTDFMAAALYDPVAGYYAIRSNQVGRAGDFFTSVSAGPLFGQLVAAHIAEWWQQSGRPSDWRLVELGAHDGSLAIDLLTALQTSHPDAFEAVSYTILEPLRRLADAQNQRLLPFSDKIHHVEDPSALDPLPGFLIANEVIDALPFHVVESEGDAWAEIGVGLGSGGEFVWQKLGPAGRLTANLPQRPAGYRSEVRPDLAAFLGPLLPTITDGRMLWVDYGFERDDYYAEPRTTGTLRTFQQHQAGEDPLAEPGRQDITAHVDFTALREAIEAVGGTVTRFENQARFLTAVARPWLLSLEGRTDPGTMKLLRNFQTLTHPGQLGSRFHVMEASFQK